jgi:hypothetical protein
LDLKEQTSAAEIKEIDKAKLALSVCNYHLYSLLKFYTKNAVEKMLFLCFNNLWKLLCFSGTQCKGG